MNFVSKLNIIPLIGIVCFAMLFLYSTTIYPGGSSLDLDALGFDWINNYWCDLMNENAANGLLNPARPFSILSMIVLCFSLMIFIIQFAEVYVKNHFWKRLLEISGVTSMIFASLIFTKFHNSMIILSSLFGIFTVIGIIREIYRSEMKGYKISGFFCILFLGLNNYIYYSKYFLEILPLLQKITLLFVLLWVIGLNIKIREKLMKFSQK